MFEIKSPVKMYYGLWPFKRKPAPEAAPALTASTVICIPGSWNDIEEIKSAIFSSSNGEYVVAGEMLLSVKRERHYNFEVCKNDARLRESFKYAARMTQISETALDEIEKHKFVVYISGDTGSLKEAEHIAFAAEAVLKAGGLGIKIESAGKAFEKSWWFNMLKTLHEADLYQMFVATPIVNNDNSVWTCGMHNLGLRDTIISGEDIETSADLLALFAYYQIFDKPVITPDQTFQSDPQSLVYRISNEPNQPFKDLELFENPFGMWRLSRV